MIISPNISTNDNSINNSICDKQKKEELKHFSLKKNEKKQVLFEKIPKLLQFIISNAKNPNFKSIFDVNIKNTINFESYLYRIFQLTDVEPSTIIYALALIDLLCFKTGSFSITKRNIHKTFFTALLISLKLNEDLIFKDSDYACFSGMSLQEMSFLEAEFLRLVDYHVFLDETIFFRYESSLM